MCLNANCIMAAYRDNTVENLVAVEYSIRNFVVEVYSVVVLLQY